MHFDHFLDASGLQCPMPLLKTKQKLNQIGQGEVLKVLTTDEGSLRDFVSFLSLSKHELLESSTSGSQHTFFILCG